MLQREHRLKASDAATKWTVRRQDSARMGDDLATPWPKLRFHIMDERQAIEGNFKYKPQKPRILAVDGEGEGAVSTETCACLSLGVINVGCSPIRR